MRGSSTVLAMWLVVVDAGVVGRGDLGVCVMCAVSASVVVGIRVVVGEGIFGRAGVVRVAGVVVASGCKRCGGCIVLVCASCVVGEILSAVIRADNEKES